MSTTFHTPINDATAELGARVAAARSVGSPTVTVVDGSLYGTTFPAFATAARGGVTLAIFEVTGRTGNVLTVSGTVDGTTDVALQVDDAFEPRPNRIAITEIHDAVHALETTVVVLPYATTLQVANAGRFAMWGNSVAVGAGGGGTTIPGVLSALESRVGYNGGVGGETAAQIATRFLADTDKHTWPTIIEAGRNDVVAVGYSQSATMASIASMTDAMDAVGNSVYLVLTVLNAGDEPIGSSTYNTVVALNAAILARYPANSLDWRPLFVADYDPAQPQDVIDHGNDVPPTSLRSDIFHPNVAGYTRLAGHLDDNRATFSVAAMPVEPSALGSLALDDANSVHLTGAETVGGAKTFTDPATFVILNAEFYQTTGTSGGYTVSRRDNDAAAWTFYSPTGDLSLYNQVGAVNTFTVSASTNAVAFVGGVTATSFGGDGSALTGLTSGQVAGLGTAATHPATDFAQSIGGTLTGATINSSTNPIATDADGATVTFDCAAANWHQVTLGGNRTLALAGDSIGQQFTVVLVQDATGSRLATWWAGIKWPGGVVPPLTTAAGKADIFTFKKVAAGSYYGLVAGQGL